MGFSKFSRIDRVNSLILHALSDITHKDVKDPKVGLFNLTAVETSKDLKYAKVFVSVVGEEPTREETLRILNKLASFLRHRLNQEIRLKNIPELTFHLDRSVDYYHKINELLNQVKKDEEICN